MTNTLDLAAVKQEQQRTWSTGDYPAVAAKIHYAAERLVQHADLRAGWRVLDVATGSGNAAIAAARAGAAVVGVDYVPALLAAARTRAAAERLDICFVEGDAEHLPAAPADFDAVLSVFGVMFAPDQQRAASELCRVCRPGGTIALASWTPDGFVGEFFGLHERYAPSPAALPSPLAWGDPSSLRTLLGDAVTEVRSTVQTCVLRAPSADAYVTFMRQSFGPTHATFHALDDGDRRAFERDLMALVRSWNALADGESVALPATYLETIARHAG
jgi:SAM-dependent methyltransferase